MRKDWPSLEEGLEEYYEDLFWWRLVDDYDYEEWVYQVFEEENWDWWLEQVDYDAVNEVLGEDYL